MKTAKEKAMKYLENEDLFYVDDGIEEMKFKIEKAIDIALKEQANDMIMSFHSIICIPYFDERDKSFEELKQKLTDIQSKVKK